MSRKDYIAIAAALRTSHESTASRELLFDTIVKELASILKQDNPNFDKDRFYRACYVA